MPLTPVQNQENDLGHKRNADKSIITSSKVQ